MANTPAPTLGPLRRLRERAMLTQEDLAALTGLHRATIIRLEQNPTRAWDATIIKIAEALGMDPFELRDELRAVA